ncbi:MAG: methyltransferase domain-containing protein [Cyclobacteriaceae bacterium]
MIKDSHRKIEKFWDRSADSYDREEQQHEPTYQLILEKLKDYLQSTDIVLDFGCGTGLVSNKIAKSVEEIHGIDISSKMIMLAKAKADALHLENLTYAHATIDGTNLKADTYDVILAFHILHLVENTSSTIQRIKELLKPGGMLISVTPCMANKPLFSGMLSILSKIGMVPKIQSFQRQELEHLLTAASFKIIQSEKLTGTSNQYFMVGRK